MRILTDNDTTLSLVPPLAQAAQISGPMIHDAPIACQDHGVRELWSSDRDFSHYPKLRVRNPLIP